MKDFNLKSEIKAAKERSRRRTTSLDEPRSPTTMTEVEKAVAYLAFYSGRNEFLLIFKARLDEDEEWMPDPEQADAILRVMERQAPASFARASDDLRSRIMEREREHLPDSLDEPPPGLV